MKKENLLNWILGIGIIILIFINFRTCSEKNKNEKRYINNIEAFADSVTYYKNIHGEEVAHKKQLEFENSKQFLEIESNNKTISELQKTVNDYKKKLEQGSVSQIETETKLDSIFTEKEYIYLPCNDTVKIPVILGYKDEWINFRAEVIDEKFQLKTRDVLDVIIGMDKNKPFIDVINHSPYTHTLEINSVKFSPNFRQKKHHIVIGGGLGAGEKIGMVIFVGYGYSLISW